MSEIPTPRTDADLKSNIDNLGVAYSSPDFARELERELAISSLAVQMTIPWEKAMLADNAKLREALAKAALVIPWPCNCGPQCTRGKFIHDALST